MTQHRRRPQPRIHQHVELDLDEGARPITLDARTLTLPSVAIITVVVASMGLTYFLTEERSRLDGRIDTVVSTVDRLATSLSALADSLKFGMTDRYTIAHHELWCAKAEVVNKNFRCPSMAGTGIGTGISPSSTNLNSTLQGVDREMLKIRDKLQPELQGE